MVAFQCLDCGKTTENKNGMVSHILNKHTDPKPFQCTQANPGLPACNQTFARRDHLKKHVDDEHKRQLLPIEDKPNDAINNAAQAKAEAARVTVQNNNPPLAASSGPSAALGYDRMQTAPHGSNQHTPLTNSTPSADQPDEKPDPPRRQKRWDVIPGYYAHTGATWDPDGEIPGAGRNEWYDEE